MIERYINGFSSHLQRTKNYPDRLHELKQSELPVMHTESFDSYFFCLSSAPTHPYQIRSSQSTCQPTIFSLSFSSEHFPGFLETT